MVRLDFYLEDPEKWEAGSSFHLPDQGAFMVRRFGTRESNKAWNSITRALFSPCHKPDDGDFKLILAHWLVEYGVAGWHDLFHEDGEPAKYSKKAARSIFLDDRYQQQGGLNQSLYSHSMICSNYLYEEAEEDLENLKKK